MFKLLVVDQGTGEPYQVSRCRSLDGAHDAVRRLSDRDRQVGARHRNAIEHPDGTIETPTPEEPQ